jgi:general secretion pathway protein G
VVLIGLGVIALAFLGIRRESVRVIQREREAILRTDLRTIRDAIDNYTLDKHGHPKSLQDLVDAGYLRAIPVDPITLRRDWVPDFEGPVLGDPVLSPDLKAQGLFNVHSNSSRVATEGSPYNTW